MEICLEKFPVPFQLREALTPLIIYGMDQTAGGRCSSGELQLFSLVRNARPRTAARLQRMHRKAASRLERRTRKVAAIGREGVLHIYMTLFSQFT